MNGLQRVANELKAARSAHKGAPMRACRVCSVVRPVTADDVCYSCIRKRALAGQVALQARWSAEERHELAGRWRSLASLDVRTRIAHTVVLTGRRWAVVVRELVRQGFLSDSYVRAYMPRGKNG